MSMMGFIQLNDIGVEYGKNHGFTMASMGKVMAWQNSHHRRVWDPWVLLYPHEKGHSMAKLIPHGFVMRYGFCQVARVVPCVTLYDPGQAVMASCIYLLLEKFPIDWSVCNQVESGFTSADWSLRAVWCNQLCKKTVGDCRPHQSRLHPLSKIKVLILYIIGYLQVLKSGCWYGKASKIDRTS